MHREKGLQISTSSKIQPLLSAMQYTYQEIVHCAQFWEWMHRIEYRPRGLHKVLCSTHPKNGWGSKPHKRFLKVLGKKIMLAKGHKSTDSIFAGKAVEYRFCRAFWDCTWFQKFIQFSFAFIHTWENSSRKKGQNLLPNAGYKKSSLSQPTSSWTLPLCYL